MLVLKSLALSGIGRFVEEQTIDFTSLGSLVEVLGENKNTSGSSGAGKSTVLKALEFLLGLNEISNSVLQSRLTKDHVSVTGHFEWNNFPVKIQRNKKLLIDLNGEIITGSSKITEEKLDKILGMPRDLFRKILIKRQGEQGFFLNLGPSNTHKFLTSCLGLEKEQSKILKESEKLKDLIKQESDAKSKLDFKKLSIDTVINTISSLGQEPILDVSQSFLDNAKLKHSEAKETHSIAKSALRKEVEELELSRPNIAIPSFDRSGIVLIEDEVKLLESEIHKFKNLELSRQSKVTSQINECSNKIKDLNNVELIRQSNVKNEISKVKAEITELEKIEKDRQTTAKTRYGEIQLSYLKLETTISQGLKSREAATELLSELGKIKNATCPTCEQGWVTDSIKAKELEIRDKLKVHKTAVIAGQDAEKSLSTSKEELLQVSQQILPRQIDGLDTLNEKIQDLTVTLYPKVDPAIETLNSEIVELKKLLMEQVVPEVLETKLKIDFKNQELAKLRSDEKNHQDEQNDIQRTLLDAFAKKQSELRQSHTLILEHAQNREIDAFNELQSLENRVRFYNDSKKKYDDSRKNLNTQLDQYKSDLIQTKTDYQILSEKIEFCTESIKIIKSYLSCSFEDALDSIGDVATTLIRRIPNMQTATIQFEGLKETQDGKIKEEINCTISADGEIAIPLKSLSGGERSSTDLAIDLSVIKFIEENTGGGIDFMALDEPFTGLDSSNIIEALEMLREYSINKRVLLIDHNQIATQTIESRIVVTRDGLTSTISQT